VAGRAWIGTSSWNYDAWREAFYQGRPKKEWLAFCAARFSAIEVNASFYRLQSAETFRRWDAETPPGFRFAIKANRYLTHNKKLIDPLPAVHIEHEHVYFDNDAFGNAPRNARRLIALVSEGAGKRAAG
jgi:uncharacterized protein YecE (DUF72 family)